MQKKRTKTAGRKKAADNIRTASAKGGITGGGGAAAQDNARRNYELRGLAFVAAGLIFMCGIAGLNVGFIGLKAAKFLQYFFGAGAFIAAGAFLGAGGYYIMKHRKMVFKARVLGGAGFFACAMAMYHHMVVKPGEEILPESLVDGGGLLGGVITIFLHKAAGVDGTPILLAVGLLGTLLAATSWSLAQGILTTKKRAEKGADVAKKATVVVYDKTIEAGGRAKEQVQEYVQEHIDDVGDKLQRLRGRQFLARYEQDSAFLNGEAVAAVKPGGAPAASDAAELINTSPAAAGFFAQKFSSAAGPERVPELAVQLGLEAKAESGRARENSVVHKAEAADIRDDAGEAEVSEECWSDFTSGFQGEIAAEAVTEAAVEIEAEAADSMDEDADFDWEGFTGGNIEEGIEEKAEVEELEYDYGVADMSITYPEDSVDLTETIDAEAVQEEGVLQAETAPEPPAEEVSAAETVAEEASAAETAEPELPEPPPYILPPLHLLSKTVRSINESLNQEISNNARILGETLSNFKVKASILNACHGPAVTRYEVKPAPGVKVSKITGLADDIALNMAAAAVRIEQIPGKAAIGIEVPNHELESVQLREVLENPAFAAAKSRLTVGLGKDIGGQAVFADLAKMPHLLVAGATGSGKSVCINTLITSILFKAKPDEVKFILIDPKMVELSVYNDIPHLMVPVVTDAKKAASVLNWAVQEMEKRYGLIAQVGVRNMEGYNSLLAEEPEKQLPSIVIIIDELADLMMVAPHDVEDAICRIAQKARAAGIYLVLATQRPSVNVITGVIKANIPSRISFAVTSQIDSRTILDASGAEKLLGRGDMLFKPQEANKPARIQGAFVSDKEVEMLTEYIKAQGHKPEANQEIIDFTNRAAEGEAEGENGDKSQHSRIKIDSLLRDAVELIMSSGVASASGFQRRYHIGYSRAGRLLDTMEQLGIVGPPQGSKPRDILVTEAQAFEIMDEYENQ